MEFVTEEKKQAKRGNLDMKILEKLRDLKNTFSKEGWNSVSHGREKSESTDVLYVYSINL